MATQEIIVGLEKEIRANWGWMFNVWVKTHAENYIINIYKTTKGDNDKNTLLAKNLYYAMESYVYFSDTSSANFYVKDIVVFLDRIIKNQIPC
jgi:hypothetical protein